MTKSKNQKRKLIHKAVKQGVKQYPPFFKACAEERCSNCGSHSDKHAFSCSKNKPMSEDQIKTLKENFLEFWEREIAGVLRQHGVDGNLLGYTKSYMLRDRPYYFFESHLSEIQRETEQIDHSIDVRYEPDIIEMFNKFIKKWCGRYYTHLADDDENDGEYVRQAIRKIQRETKEEKRETAKKVLEMVGSLLEELSCTRIEAWENIFEDFKNDFELLSETKSK